MAKSFLTVLMLTFLFSYRSPEPPKVKTVSSQETPRQDRSIKKPDTSSLRKLGFYTLEGNSVVVPPFEIEVALSPKAKDRIVNSHETIIVAVFLEGTPKNPSKAHLEEDGSFFVGSAQKEITYGQPARFNHLQFPRKIYDQLANKDADLTVNVYTGRKSSPDNLITGDIIIDKVSKVINKHFILHQKLIYGDD